MVGEGGEGEREAAARGRFALAAACLLALAPLLGGCGLEEYVVLQPPASASTDAADTTFSHNIENDSFEFLGYEVVYRIYDTMDKARTDASIIESSWTSLPPSSIVTRLNAQHFVRPVVDTGGGFEENSPVFPIDDAEFGTAIPFTLSFSATGASTRGAATFKIRRLAKDNSTGFHKTFGDTSLSIEDCNYNEATEPNPAHVLVYAYAYGQDSKFQDIYSQVVRLGIIGFELKPTE